jgi:hypothetical protein
MVLRGPHLVDRYVAPTGQAYTSNLHPGVAFSLLGFQKQYVISGHPAGWEITLSNLYEVDKIDDDETTPYSHKDAEYSVQTRYSVRTNRSIMARPDGDCLLLCIRTF